MIYQIGLRPLRLQGSCVVAPELSKCKTLKAACDGPDTHSIGHYSTTAQSVPSFVYIDWLIYEYEANKMSTTVHFTTLYRTIF